MSVKSSILLTEPILRAKRTIRRSKQVSLNLLGSVDQMKKPITYSGNIYHAEQIFYPLSSKAERHSSSTV